MRLSLWDKLLNTHYIHKTLHIKHMLRKTTMTKFIKEIKNIFDKGTIIGTKSTGCAGYRT